MDLIGRIEKLTFDRTETGGDPRYLLLDRQSYFELKELHYKSIELAIQFELEEFNDLKIFYNDSTIRYIDVV